MLGYSLITYLACPQYLCSLIVLHPPPFSPLNPLWGRGGVYPSPSFLQYCKNNIIYEQNWFKIARTVLSFILIPTTETLAFLFFFVFLAPALAFPLWDPIHIKYPDGLYLPLLNLTYKHRLIYTGSIFSIKS